MDIQCTCLKMIFALQDPPPHPNIQIMIKVTAEWFILETRPYKVEERCSPDF
jgi:hypothetical protein